MRPYCCIPVDKLFAYGANFDLGGGGVGGGERWR